jgi:SSS family solute:Na+ symporter
MAAAGDATALEGEEVVPADRLPFEYMLNALRLVDGFALADFAARTGLPPSTVAARIDLARQHGWLAQEGDRVRPTALGQRFANDVVALFLDSFPGWFAGLAFAAIAIGALVPAAIMSIAAANLWTRNVYKEYLVKNATPKQEATQAKWASLVVKFGAVLFILFIDPQFSIDLQLIGGVIILQTLPAVAIALYTRWLHSKALIAGWVVGMAWGLYLLWTIPNPAIGKEHFGGSALTLSQLSIFGWHPFEGSTVQIYVGIVALLANLLVAVVVTVALRMAGVRDGRDATRGKDYHADEGDPQLREIAVH